MLQAITRETVRGEVISQYTLIDEQLGSKICHYMFENRAFMKLWKTKKFARFNYFILEKISLMEKLAFVKDVLHRSEGNRRGYRNYQCDPQRTCSCIFP